MENGRHGSKCIVRKFLKAMWSRLMPEMAGLPSSLTTRRVPGLLREEVARVADVRTDYYTRLEQGRNIHPSRAVLDSLGRALNLDPGGNRHT
jgi:transcriptional regulator with XRE-family HTH domain